MKDEKVRVCDIRKYFFNTPWLRSFQTVNNIIVQDWKISPGAIADIAVIMNCCILYGYAIKSEVDSVARFQSQSEEYNKVFDFMDIILFGDHYTQWLDKGAEYIDIPDTWGVLAPIWNEDIEGVVFYRERPIKHNKKTDIQAMVGLLWKMEVVEIIKGLHIPGYATRSKSAIYRGDAQHILREALIDYVRVTRQEQHLRRMICYKIKNRKGWKDEKQKQ